MCAHLAVHDAWLGLDDGRTAVVGYDGVPDECALQERCRAAAVDEHRSQPIQVCKRATCTSRTLLRKTALVSVL